MQWHRDNLQRKLRACEQERDDAVAKVPPPHSPLFSAVLRRR
jgi:hypothetical protein